MGEGVSLSLPLLVANLLLISREHGVYGKINLPLLAHRTANGRRDTLSSGARHALTIFGRQDPGFLGAEVLAQATWGEMPKSWYPNLWLTDPSRSESRTPDPVLGLVKGDNGELSGSHYGVKTSAAASLKVGGHKSILSAGNPGLFMVGSRSRDPDPVNGVGKGNNGARYKASAPKTTRMDDAALGLSVTACGELCFSGGSNLTQPMPSLGSSGLLKCGSEPASPYPFDGVNDGRWVGSHVGVKALVMATPVIRASVKAMCIGYDPLIRRFGLVSRDLISNLVGLGPLSGRICFLTASVRLALQGDMFLA